MVRSIHGGSLPLFACDGDGCDSGSPPADSLECDDLHFVEEIVKWLKL
jgi:hypothetical protein